MSSGSSSLPLLGAAAVGALIWAWLQSAPQQALPMNDEWQTDGDEKKAEREKFFAQLEARKRDESRLRALGLDRVNNYNFAVTGVSGSGKSSLVNAFRGTHDSDEAHAAEVEESETTMDARAYPDPRNERLVFWDIPGCGTEAHPSEGYFERQGLFLFDALIIVVHRNLREQDLQVAREARTLNVPVYFVRSRSDESIHNKKKSSRCSEVEAIRRIRTLVNKQERELQDKGFPTHRIFLVCADRLRDFVNGCHEELLDESELMAAIVRLVMVRRATDLGFESKQFACGNATN